MFLGSYLLLITFNVCILFVEERGRRHAEKESCQQKGDTTNQTLYTFNSNIAASSSSSQTSTLSTNTRPKRRRARNPENWKRNINKVRRLKGEEYITDKGKTIPSQPMKSPSCRGRPKHKCCELISEDVRINIYNQFRSFESLQAQREFLVRHITQGTPKRKVVSGDSRKKHIKQYTLSDGSVSHNVCREFFLATLGISEGLIKGAFKKLSSTGEVLPDQRGKNKKT